MDKVAVYLAALDAYKQTLVAVTTASRPLDEATKNKMVISAIEAYVAALQALGG